MNVAETFNTSETIFLTMTPYRPLTRLERVLEDGRIFPLPPKLTVFDSGCGVKGIRDSDNPCEVFDPGPASGDCQTDGHYLCIECRELDPKSEYANDDCPTCTHWKWKGTKCPECDGSGQVSRLR